MAMIAVTDYRANFYDLVIKHFGSRFHLLTGTETFVPSVASDFKLGSNMSVVQNRFFFNRRLMFQHGVIGLCVKAEVAVLVMNPRVLSGWIILLIRKFLGKKTVLWGHAWPRAGKHARTVRVRGWMCSLADVILAYTQTEAAELLEVMPGKTIIAVPNALYYKREMTPAHDGQAPTNFIYVGRLVAEKKPELLLNAYATLVDRLPRTCNLVFVGSGPMQEYLARRTAELGLSDRVRFTGHIADVQQLREFYSRAIASVSPGYVGLSLIQSLGFGVPMVIADDEPHAPEIEAVREGENARFFTADSVESLARELMCFTGEGQYWYEKREEIAKFARDRYSSEAMATEFIAATTGRSVGPD